MIILFDTVASRAALYPLSLTKPICHIRFGILTIQEWWQLKTGQNALPLTENYLQTEPLAKESLFICIDAAVWPTDDCITKILQLKAGEMVEDDNGLIAYAISTLPLYNQLPVWIQKSITTERQLRINHVSFLFKNNETAIRQQFDLIAEKKVSATVASNNTIIGKENFFAEDGVDMQACIINAFTGPVYIGKNALVMEGTTIRGPVAICEGAVVKMGAQLYSGTTIGPYCTAGGEIKNSILMGYCNKAHHGYLGDSILGEWCNLGAGSTNSNVKNTASEVKMWHESTKEFTPVGIKAGLVMGDYSRSAINSSFNTGTIIGVSSHVFDGTYPAKHLPSFSWGNYDKYELEKVYSDAANWKKLKGKEFTTKDQLILQHIWEVVNRES